MRPSGTHLYKRVCPSVHPSVRRSVCMYVTQGQKPRFSAVFGQCEILTWNKWSTSMFWEPFLPLCRFTRLFVHLTLHICHMINTQRHGPYASLPGRACLFQSWPLSVWILVGSSIGQFRPSTTNILQCVLFCTSLTSILSHSYSYSNAHQVTVSPYHYQSSLNHLGDVLSSQNCPY